MVARCAIFLLFVVCSVSSQDTTTVTEPPIIIDCIDANGKFIPCPDVTTSTPAAATTKIVQIAPNSLNSALGWEQLAAGVPQRGNCDSPWVAYERKRLNSKNRRKYFRGNIEGSTKAPGGRRGPCAEDVPPLYY